MFVHMTWKCETQMLIIVVKNNIFTKFSIASGNK